VGIACACRWDYGYQIAQIANRTTLADGNTWNHEHIALLGKILVSPVKESHDIVRHLADYVLVWSTRFVGNPGDDIAKSPHMARIGGSVFKDVNPNDFYVDSQGRPSRMMAESLVYNLVLNKFDPSVPALPKGTYKEAYTSTNRMVRIYKIMNISKESKAYCAENRGYQAYLAGTFHFIFGLTTAVVMHLSHFRQAVAGRLSSGLAITCEVSKGLRAVGRFQCKSQESEGTGG
jgi:asparagine N-glycosylation enzyme membrane subunit Stt3